jgi:hypothetical protein
VPFGMDFPADGWEFWVLGSAEEVARTHTSWFQRRQRGGNAWRTRCARARARQSIHSLTPRKLRLEFASRSGIRGKRTVQTGWPTPGPLGKIEKNPYLQVSRRGRIPSNLGKRRGLPRNLSPGTPGSPLGAAGTMARVRSCARRPSFQGPENRPGSASPERPAPGVRTDRHVGDPGHGVRDRGAGRPALWSNTGWRKPPSELSAWRGCTGSGW